MPAKPIVLLACAAALGGALALPLPACAATPVTVVLFPRTLSNDDDVKALVDVRKKLRSDGAYEVITYDPASAAIKRASAEAHHPEWLVDPMGNDAERLALARALGAAFSIVVTKADGRGKMDVRMSEAAGALTWSGTDEKADDAARFIREQAAFALAHRAVGALAPVPLAAVPAPPVPVLLVAPPSPAAPVSAAAPALTPLAAPPPPVSVPPVVVTPITPPAPAVVPPARITTPAPAAAKAPSAPAGANTLPAVPPVALVPVPLAERPLPMPPVRAPQALPTPSVTLPAPRVAPSFLPAVSAPPRIPPPVRTALALPAAVLLPEHSKTEQTLVVPSPLPIPAPSRVVVAPAAPPAPRSDEDLVPVRATLAQGDDALGAGNFVAAIAAYRDAVNGAPLAMMPRLKLAQAYLQSDRRDKALGEAQRALAIAPNDPAVQQFLMQLDAETGSSDGAVARFQASVAQSPQDPAAHLELADAFWNNGALSQAESEYQSAQSLAGPGTPGAQQAAAHLARLYAAQSRYADSLAALKQAGAGGYALALGIVQSRADALRSSLDAGLGLLDSGKTTHEAFYKTASDAQAQAQALADFVVKVSPPPAFGVSHLHRVLATHLMAQQAAVLVNYVETSDASFSGQAALLEKEALTEMLTAHAAEQKLGLWGASHAEARN